ncbi:ABC-2 type transport system ATP-binding protein [Caloramator quimbayensis]|uniref:ABC-2 type transport system ATP-binding protein n=1 Tax=Caloramator quimbayensis TaxID=1147123 RepID=A0A1T4YFP8_9CLOT|nr:ABC transporter ATP-binding protein [Caloramator quimbayensis]SKB00408.1 ABC-2 type transport system ATP-binding protein [Caloramator quimbayensis]
MIKALNLTKIYGKHVAIKNVNFQIDKGEIVGFLGPNGAGKTTTLNIITGYMSPSQGSVEIDGLDIIENSSAVKKKIGYLPDVPPLYMDMTVGEYLDFVYNIKKADISAKEKAINEIIETVKIGDVKNRLIKNLSKGYRQRVGIAQALVGNPEILILDEPTSGLDPVQIIEIRNLIKSIGENRTVFLSSHILSEIEAVCNRIIIINKGEIVASGTPLELRSHIEGSRKLQLKVKSDKSIIDDLLKISGVKNVSIINNAKQEEIEIDTIDIVVESEKGKDIREDVFMLAAEKRRPILMMVEQKFDLEDIFLQVTGKEENKTN